MQQHFPLLYLCIYNIVSLLWANHSCSAIHLLTSLFFFLILFSVGALLADLLTHSHHVLFLGNFMSFSVGLKRASACLLLD